MKHDRQIPRPRRVIKARKFPSSAAQQIAMEDAVSLQQQGRGEIQSDVLGSWTGSPCNDERPEQDPDDL